MDQLHELVNTSIVTHCSGLPPAYTRSVLLTHDTLGDCPEASLAGMTAAQVAPTDWPQLAPFLSILLYLCAANREIHDPQGREFPPPTPKATVVTTKKGGCAFAADRINTWQVAWRIGAALAAAERHAADGRPDGLPPAPTGRTVKPHVRRAHFHLFWSGAGRTEPRVKWLPPIPVNVGPGREPTVVVHPVGDRSD